MKSRCDTCGYSYNNYCALQNRWVSSSCIYYIKRPRINKKRLLAACTYVGLPPPPTTLKLNKLRLILGAITWPEIVDTLDLYTCYTVLDWLTGHPETERLSLPSQLRKEIKSLLSLSHLVRPPIGPLPVIKKPSRFTMLEIP